MELRLPTSLPAPPLARAFLAQGAPGAGKYPDGGTDPATWTQLPAGRSARVFNASNFSAANASVVILTWDSEDWDSDAFHSTVSNTSRLTAPVTGKYLILATLRASTGLPAGKLIAPSLHKNGNTPVALGVAVVYSPVNGATPSAGLAALVSLAAGDYVELAVFQDSGGLFTFDASQSHFEIAQVGN